MRSRSSCSLRSEGRAITLPPSRWHCEREQIVGRFAGETSRSEDCPLVLTEHLKPRTDIIGMAHGRPDRQRSAGEGACQLRHELLAGIGAAPEGAGEVAVQPAFVPGPVAKLVEGRAVEVDVLGESLLRRHLHEVGIGRVECGASADPEVCTGCCNQCLGMGNGFALARKLRQAGKLLWQTLALIGVEGGEALQEGNLPRLPILISRPLLLALRREAVGIANGGALLAFATCPPSCSACQKVSQRCEE